MWTANTETLSGNSLKIMIEAEVVPMSVRAVLKAWRDEADFRRFFSSLLAGVSFPAFRWNLGGDATLVVPSPRGPTKAYGHLAAFFRLAPDTQKGALWIAVSAAMEKRISAKPVWLSTAGAGVAWLHVRLDDRPKYYRHAPYPAVANRVTLP